MQCPVPARRPKRLHPPRPRLAARDATLFSPWDAALRFYLAWLRVRSQDSAPWIYPTLMYSWVSSGSQWYVRTKGLYLEALTTLFEPENTDSRRGFLRRSRRLRLPRVVLTGVGRAVIHSV